MPRRERHDLPGRRMQDRHPGIQGRSYITAKHAAKNHTERATEVSHILKPSTPVGPQSSVSHRAKTIPSVRRGIANPQPHTTAGQPSPVAGAGQKPYRECVEVSQILKHTPQQVHQALCRQTKTIPSVRRGIANPQPHTTAGPPSPVAVDGQTPSRASIRGLEKQNAPPATP